MLWLMRIGRIRKLKEIKENVGNKGRTEKKREGVRLNSAKMKTKSVLMEGMMRANKETKGGRT